MQVVGWAAMGPRCLSEVGPRCRSEVGLRLSAVVQTVVAEFVVLLTVE